MPAAPILVWFRRDLRLADNPALAAAVAMGRPVVPVFLLDEAAWGGAERRWLSASLAAIDESLRGRGSHLRRRRGRPEVVLPTLLREFGAEAVHWNGDAPEVAAVLGDRGISFAAPTLFGAPPRLNNQGQPYKVFTAWWKAMRTMPVDRPLPAPDQLVSPPASQPLTPVASPEGWRVGEEGAWQRLNAFLDDGLADYARRRELPAAIGTSRLSPHLAFGEISARQVWHAVQGAAMGREAGAETFLKELGWREFAFHTLAAFPHLSDRNLNPLFDAYPWRDDAAGLAAWKEGRTGFPLVDAGMRELAATGWMHNRVRMVAGSFLTRLLGIHWKAGLDWFRESLLDHDPAVNAMNWQWVAGTGVDAQPFFRIFSPARQAERFDPEGAYIHRWAPDTVPPILDYGQARRQALAAYRDLK